MLEKLGVAGARMDDDLIIFVTELLTVIALAAEHGPAWSGSVVASIIDNDNANIAINMRRSRNRNVRYLLLILTALEFKYKFRMVAYYVNTHSNWLLDGIGRFERFRGRSDDEVREMIQRELIDAHVPGLVFESLSTLLEFFTSGETAMRTFALPGGSISELAAEFVLSVEKPDSSSSSEAGEPIEAERSMALAAGHVGLGEIAAGTGALSQSAEDRGVGTVFFMEWDRQKFKFLEALHPDAVHRCCDIMGNEYASWLFPGLQPRIVCGGPPCVFAARSGKQLGLSDPRSLVFTRGTGLVIRGISRGRVGKVWFVIIENVGEVALLDSGAALLEFLRDLY